MKLVNKAFQTIKTVRQSLFLFAFSVLALGCQRPFHLNSASTISSKTLASISTESQNEKSPNETVPDKKVTINRRQFSGVQYCSALKDLANKEVDASGAITSCVDHAKPGNIVALPPGKYLVSSQITVSKSVVLTTMNKIDAKSKCQNQGDTTCAELVASPSLYAIGGIIRLMSEGAGMDHIIVNGNRQNRDNTQAQKSCQDGTNGYGYNMQMICKDCFFTYSVSKNALCGTGLEVSSFQPGILIKHSAFVSNGRHDMKLLWADGLTVHDSANADISNNELIDNTDVDLIFGGCQNCKIQNNTILHSDSFASSSFASLHLQSWPNGTSGNYGGSDVSGNKVDCGPNRRCGFGMYIGGDAWYNSTVYGGSVHDNTVNNAQQGINVDKTTGVVRFYDNFATNSGGGTKASCGFRGTSLYNISPESKLDRSLDRVPDNQYRHEQFDGCIPNSSDWLVKSLTDADKNALIGLYKKHLGRHPDFFGYENFKMELLNGNSLQNIEKAIADSPEAQTRRANYVHQIVRRAYLQFLLREPDTSGLNSFTQYLSNGNPYSEMLKILSSSQEGRAVSIRQAYLHVLRRNVDPSGFENGFRKLEEGGLTHLYQFLAQSPEGQSVGANALVDAVTGFYWQILGRAPEPSGLSSWVQRAASGVNLDQIKIEIASSPEAVNRGM